MVVVVHIPNTQCTFTGTPNDDDEDEDEDG